MLKARNPTHFSLDFDHTITNDPIMWGKLIGVFRTFGHQVTIVTGRKSYWDNVDIIEFCNIHNIDVIFTECQAKREFVKRLGINIDVWIDDLPEAITADWCPDEQKITKCYTCNPRNGE